MWRLEFNLFFKLPDITASGKLFKRAFSILSRINFNLFDSEVLDLLEISRALAKPITPATFSVPLRSDLS